MLEYASPVWQNLLAKQRPSKQSYSKQIVVDSATYTENRTGCLGWTLENVADGHHSHSQKTVSTKLKQHCNHCPHSPLPAKCGEAGHVCNAEYLHDCLQI